MARDDEREAGRRHGATRRIAALALAIVGVLAAPAASACSCIQPADPGSELEQADAVFSGRVTAVQPLGSRGFPRLAVHFALAAVWKGMPEGEVVTVTTAADSAACGFPFEKSEDYLVYAYEDDGELSTGLCTRNALLADAAEDLAALGPPRREVAAESTK